MLQLCRIHRAVHHVRKDADVAVYEIIVVDDGSKDDSLSIILEQSKQDSRIKVFDLIINCKSFFARYWGIKNATGNYIMFLDGDDYFERDACEVAYSMIEQKKADVLEFKATIHDGDSSKEFCNIVQGRLVGNDILERLSRNSIGQMLWNKIYRANLVKDVYESIPPVNLYYLEDVYFTTLIYARSSIYYGLRKPLYHYFKTTGQSRKFKRTSFEDFREQMKMGAVWNYLFVELTKMKIEDEVFQRSVHAILWNKMQLYIKRSLTLTLRYYGNDRFDDAVGEYKHYWFRIGNYGESAERYRRFAEKCLNDALGLVNEIAGGDYPFDHRKITEQQLVDYDPVVFECVYSGCVKTTCRSSIGW